MFNKDNTGFGIFLGLILPALSFFLVEILKQDIYIRGKNHLIYIFAVACNLILVRLFYGNGKEQMARGIIATTFICAFAIFIYKSRS